MSVLEIVFYSTASGNSQPIEFLDDLPENDRYYIEADLATLAEHGDRAPVSIKTITGHSPMLELRTGGFRLLMVRENARMWVLHICRKQDQRRGIDVAAKRMKHVLRGETR